MVPHVTTILQRFTTEWAALLQPDAIRTVCREIGYTAWRDRVLSPVTTMQLFLLQILHGNTACSHLPHLSGLRFTAAALDYAAQNLRVNAVCPRYIDTPMMGRFTGGTPEGRAKVIAEEPVGRMGKPEEIAAAVVWLCSDAAAFVVGHAMVIDGGQTV
jgi:hypothetical protein